MRLAAVCFLGVCGAVWAQLPPTLVVNTGVATVTEAPNVIELNVERVYQDTDIVVAMAQAGNFEGRLRETLNINKLYPTEIIADAPYVRSLADGEVVVVVRLQFALPRLGNTVDRVTQVTLVRNSLAAMSEALKFTYSEPEWMPEDGQKMERDAVLRATENAYHHAEAVANSLENNINNVDSVEVLGVEWNTVPGQPNMNEVSCTARVKVVYALAHGN